MGVGSWNLADPVPDNRGPGSTKCRRRSGRTFAAIRFHGRQNALAPWVAAILRIRGSLLVPCGSTVARNSILAEVDKSCKGEEKIFSRRSKKTEVQSVPRLPHQDPRAAQGPPYCRPLPAISPHTLQRTAAYKAPSEYGRKYGRKQKRGRKPHHSTISGPLVELRGTARTAQKQILSGGGGI